LYCGCAPYATRDRRMRRRNAMMMTRRKLYVTLRTAALMAMAFCAAIIAGCDDQLLPPEQLSQQMSYQGRIFYSAPTLSGDVVMSVASGESVPATIAKGKLASPPQSGRIAYYRSGVNGEDSIYINSVDGNEEKLIALGPSYGRIDSSSVTLAPDGARVAYLTSDPFNISYDLHVVDASAPGKDFTVSLATLDVMPLPGGQFVWFSPTSDTIIIASMGLGKGVPCYIIYPLDSLYGGIVEVRYLYEEQFITGVTFSPRLQPAWTVNGGANNNGVMIEDDFYSYEWIIRGIDYYHSPAWSPGSDSIAFAVSGQGPGGSVMSDLYTTMAVQEVGSAQRITTTPDMVEIYTSWSPYGRNLLFTELASEPAVDGNWVTGRLVVVDMQSKQTRVIANNAYKGFWSRD
jgi:hypothetical protein